MKTDYTDITSLIEAAPLWFDENAVPRYSEFKPSRAVSIHIGEVALAEITCQSCGRPLLVAFSAVNHSDDTIAEAIGNRTLHYGDPPFHHLEIPDRSDDPRCVGNTMNSQPRRVLEYWRRHDQRYVEGNRITNLAYFEWTRDHSLETDLASD